MKFQQLLSILRARARIILGSLGVALVLSLIVNILLPKTYDASASMIVNYKASDPVTGALMPSALMAGYMATQVDIIQSQSVAVAVVDALHLVDAPGVKEDFNKLAEGKGDIRDWLAALLLKNLTVVPARESGVVTITFSGADPAFAATVANTFAREYQNATVRLKVQPLKQAAQYLNEQSKTLRDRLEQAQARLSKYQQEKGLVSVDNRLDIEIARLNDLSTQLVMSQGQVVDANSRKGGAEGSVAASPDVLNNALVQNLKSALAAAEGRFSELGARVGTNHPQYVSAKAEVAKLRAELNSQMNAISGSLGTGARIAQRREADLSSSLAAQKARVLELNRERDELAVLTREVDGAQRTYDAAITRLAQTTIEGGSNQPDVAVLSNAVPPMKPASPRKLLNTALAIVLGTAFGFGLTIVLELFNRRVHSAYDVVDLQIPVLSEMNWGKRKSRLRLPKLSSQNRRRALPA